MAAGVKGAKMKNPGVMGYFTTHNASCVSRLYARISLSHMGSATRGSVILSYPLSLAFLTPPFQTLV